MTNPRISIIVALAKNMVIGGQNQLLWRIPEDLKRFRKLTTGHPIIIGRKTHQSIGRVLPDRPNIVITRENIEIPDCIVCHSIEEALEKAKALDSKEIFIIGGAQIYKETISLADRLYLTLVDKEFAGDAYFPNYSMFTKKIFEEKGAYEELKYSFLILEK